MPDNGRSGGLDTRTIVRAGVAIVAMLALALVGAYAALRTWGQAAGPPAPDTPFDLLITGPVLESDPEADRVAYMAQKDTLLHGYG